MAVDLTRVAATDPLPLYRYRDGLYAVDLLIVAVAHLDFFSWLAAHPSDAGAIYGHFGFHPRPADVLLTLCRANGLVRRAGDTFHVTTLAREHLTGGSPWDLTPYYASLADRPVARDFARALKTGRPASWNSEAGAADWHALMEQESFARAFTAAMDCRGTYLGAALARHVDLSQARRYSALLVHATQGRCYSTAEFDDALRAAGFTPGTFTTTAADRGVITARKAAIGAPGS